MEILCRFSRHTAVLVTGGIAGDLSFFHGPAAHRRIPSKRPRVQVELVPAFALFASCKSRRCGPWYGAIFADHRVAFAIAPGPANSVSGGVLLVVKSHKHRRSFFS